MTMILDHFVKTLSCKRVLEAAGVQIETTGETRRVRCLHRECRRWVVVSGDAMVCENHSCRFRAGNVLDYLATNRGYAPTLTWLAESFPKEVASFSEVSWEINQPALQLECETRRELFSFFAARRGPFPPLPPFPPFRGLDVNQTSLESVVFYLPEDEVLKLSQLVTNVSGKVRELVSVGPAMAVPYYSAMNELCEVQVMTADGASMFWQVSAAEFCYAGLLEIKNLQPALHSNLLDAVDNLSRMRALDPNFSVTVVRHHPKNAGKTRLTFPAKYYLTANESITLLTRLAESQSDMEVGVYADGDQTRPWLDYINHRLNSRLALGETDKLRKDLLDLTMSQESWARWLGFIKDFYPELYVEVTRHSGNEKVYQVRGAEVVETRSGYVIRKKNAAPKLVTNFTVELHKTIFFKDSPDLFHEGVVRFKSEEYPVRFPHRELHSPRGIESAVLMADAHARSVAGDSTPAIPDRQAAAPVTLLLGELAQTLRRVEGTLVLGWSPSRDEFVGPSWTVNCHGVHSRETVPHPNVPILNSYDFRPNKPLAQDTEDLDASTLLSLMVAMTARYYAGRPLAPLIFRATPETQSALKTAFGALGQRKVIMLSYNARGGYKGLESLRGYPALVTGMTIETAEKCNDPVFLLAEVGRELGEFESPVAVTNFIRTYFPKALAWMLESGDDLPFFTEGEYEAMLLKEGQAILEASGCPTLKAMSTTYPHLKKKLQRTPDIGALVRCDRTEARLLWTIAELTEHELAELQQIDPTAHGKRQLSTDRLMVEAQLGKLISVTV